MLDQAITEVIREDLGTLALQFTDGSTLRTYDSSEHYESYQVHHEGRIFAI
jgi:hypothetical protein